MSNIKFDKRMELIFGLQYYVTRKYGVNFPWIDNKQSEYTNKFYDFCDKNISKEFVDYIISGGLGCYDVCITIAFHIDENYNIVDRDNFEERILNDKNIDINKLESLLKDFSEKSNYEDFFKSNEEYYNFISNKYETLLNEYEPSYTDKILNFYGYKNGEMNIIQLDFSAGNYGQTYKGNTYYINGVRNITSPEFHFSDGTLNTLYHEFSHPYMNPLGEKYFKELELSNLFLESKNNGLQNCYNGILTVINEYCVRAAAICLAKSSMDKESYNRRIEYDKKIGFIHIEELCELLDNRNLYSTFEEFYKNEIVPFFINLEKELST